VRIDARSSTSHEDDRRLEVRPHALEALGQQLRRALRALAADARHLDLEERPAQP
jgi:hypothetical protein